MTIETALALAAMLAGPMAGPTHQAAPIDGDSPGVVASDPVLDRMAPAPGRWEVEDAPPISAIAWRFRTRPAHAPPGRTLPKVLLPTAVPDVPTRCRSAHPRPLRHPFSACRQMLAGRRRSG